MTEMHLLVVEDDADGQEVVARMLRYHKIPFDVVGNGEDALHLTREKSFTGAIIDLALPGIDGWTLLKTLHREPATGTLPCIAVTAYHSAEVAVKAIEAGFAAYFPKPLDSTTFVRELRRVLAI